MTKQQIEGWIDENKQLAFVDENHAEHMIPLDKFRKLLKTHAIVPREAPNSVLEMRNPPMEIGLYKAMIESSEKGELDE